MTATKGQSMDSTERARRDAYDAGHALGISHARECESREIGYFAPDGENFVAGASVFVRMESERDTLALDSGARGATHRGYSDGFESVVEVWRVRTREVAGALGLGGRN